MELWQWMVVGGLLVLAAIGVAVYVMLCIIPERSMSDAAEKALAQDLMMGIEK